MADNQLQISTPNIDKLKKRGVTFKNSFTNNPVCGASRASLLTGLRPTKSRFTTFYTKINEDTPNSLTIASHLKNNGYKTISNGKISHHARDAAYGWDDISTNCEFIADYEVEEGKRIPWRYRWPEEVHDEVLTRLLEFNQKRYEEEVYQGLHDKNKPKAKAEKSSKGQTELF